MAEDISVERDFYEHCMVCDLRTDVKEKLSVKIFGIFVASMVALLAIMFGVGGIGVDRIVKNSDLALEAIHQIEQRTARIEAKQEILLQRNTALGGTVYYPYRAERE